MNGISPYTMPSTTAPWVLISFSGLSMSPSAVSSLFTTPVPIKRIFQP